MKLKNVLIAVTEIERSIQFYKELFGLDVILDNGGNVILTEGLVLQDRALWEQSADLRTIPQNNATLLYFEEQDIEGFVERLKKYSVQCLCPLTELVPGRKMIRFYDPDGNLIEVGTPWR